MSGQWPAFEVLQGQKGKQMAASPWRMRGFAVSGESQSSAEFVARWEPQLDQAPGQAALARLVPLEACAAGDELAALHCTGL